MRIVIDMQGAQFLSSNTRGVERYSLSLTRAIVRNCGSHEIIIVLNGIISGTDLHIRAAFDGLLPKENIRIWYPSGDVSYSNPDNAWRRSAAELMREAFLASLKPDVILVTSLLEGFFDLHTVSIGRLSPAIPTAVILYDLIPLIYPHLYLVNPIFKNYYKERLDNLCRVDMLLSISESSRQEAIDQLGFNKEKVTNISTAVTEMFRPIAVAQQRKNDIFKRYGISLPFIMYTGGSDHRKNIDGLLRAYAALPVILRMSHQLVIVCELGATKHRLLQLASKCGLKKYELVFTGFVSEDDLLTLYNLCKVFVFPSWHEGFGLPVLEAMSCGRAVIGGNSTSIPEIIRREDSLFDPHNDNSIAELMERVLIDDKFRSDLERHGIESSKRFSWDLTAKKAITALEQLAGREEARIKAVYNETVFPYLIQELVKIKDPPQLDIEWLKLAQALSLTFPDY